MEIEQLVPTFSDTIVDLKRALEIEDDEVLAIKKSLRLIDAIVELRDCSAWPAKYVTVSRKWEQWCGLREHDIVGATDYDYRPRKIADDYTLILKAVIQAGKTMSYVAAGAGNEASSFKAVRFSLTPFMIARKDFIIAIGHPVAR
jgi:hypothetical protein